MTKWKMGLKGKTAIVVTVLNLFLFFIMVSFSKGVINYGELKAFDLVSILLTTVSVLLAILGVIIAIVAVWGYNFILDKAVKEAAKSASDRFDKILPELEKRLSDELFIKLDLIKSSYTNNNADEQKEEQMLTALMSGDGNVSGN